MMSMIRRMRDRTGLKAKSDSSSLIVQMPSMLAGKPLSGPKSEQIDCCDVDDVEDVLSRLILPVLR